MVQIFTLCTSLIFTLSSLLPNPTDRDNDNTKLSRQPILVHRSETTLAWRTIANATMASISPGTSKHLVHRCVTRVHLSLCRRRHWVPRGTEMTINGRPTSPTCLALMKHVDETLHRMTESFRAGFGSLERGNDHDTAA